MNFHLLIAKVMSKVFANANSLFIPIYFLFAWLLMRWMKGNFRELLFALLNLTGLFCICCSSNWFEFLIYLLAVVLQYILLRVFAKQVGWQAWIGFSIPLLMLVIARYVLPNFHLALVGLYKPVHLIGISYLAFRCSRLVLEIRNSMVTQPNLWQYLNFAFFLPAMFVGPIDTYANFRRGFDGAGWRVSYELAGGRLLVGMVKYFFIGGLFGQLTYVGMLENGNYHPWVHLPIAMVSYYLYLYFNFSGACDMVIGAAGIIGIPVAENFDNPLMARNMREFWNRWHITLSQYMRDIVFAPLSKALVRILGPARLNLALAITITVVFLLIGIWHGVGWNYAAFGLAQALGVVTVHYYTIFLKKKLGRDGFKAYNENRWIHGAAVAVTFCYYAATLFLFANTGTQMKQIFSILR